jgi:hypothetical protein
MVNIRGGLGWAAALPGMDAVLAIELLGLDLLTVALTTMTDVVRTTGEEPEPLMVTLKTEVDTITDVVRMTDAELELAIVLVSEVVDRLVAVVVEVPDTSVGVACEVVLVELELIDVLAIEVLLISALFTIFPEVTPGATPLAAVDEP